jgi:hypothetical protein
MPNSAVYITKKRATNITNNLLFVFHRMFNINNQGNYEKEKLVLPIFCLISILIFITITQIKGIIFLIQIVLFYFQVNNTINYFNS